MSYRTIAHHASSVRLTTSEVPVAGKGIFQTIYPEVLAFRQGTSPPSAKGTGLLRLTHTKLQKPKDTPLELLALLLLAFPELFTLQKLLVLPLLGERSHQLFAEQ